MIHNQRPVISKLSGGIGNQMFQYAIGRTLALRMNAPLILDISWFSTHEERPFALDKLCISGDIYHTPFAESKLLAGPISKLATPLIRMRFGVPVYKVRQFNFDPHILEIKGGVYLKGYWQSEKYFEKESEKVRLDFRCKHPLTPARQRIANQIDGRTAISVHVRRGDYVSSNKNGANLTCSPQWYSMAMEKMALNVTDPTFFVFSDDPDWARANLPMKWEAHFIEPQHDRRDFEDMQLMSRCQHHIIANSSFSWWGAWLNASKTKRVIAPAVWFADPKINTADLVPEEWDLI